MSYYLQSMEDENVHYEVVGCNPEREEVTLKGPLATIVVSWANNSFEKYGYKLVKEDGSDAQLEELQAELQAGG